MKNRTGDFDVDDRGATLKFMRERLSYHPAYNETRHFMECEFYRTAEVNRRAKTMSNRIPMTKSGYCQCPSVTNGVSSHAYCNDLDCTCSCHGDQRVFTGQGIIFAVLDNREAMKIGPVSTIDVIAEAIDKALDAGHETSDEIARFITTSNFQHVRDRRAQFNSVLRASDTVGAQIVKKLVNSYNELASLGDVAEARGFAEAIQIVMSPFSTEDELNQAMVNWDSVDELTDLFEEEQAEARQGEDNEEED